ncbi:caspase family protein [Longispora sp. NPDC051575]|uniref:caspase, EACC1-associated type n=1 Tax=Longispora sp. NPDC051575 TaxID=3154943 RepID=UPI003437C1DA
MGRRLALLIATYEHEDPKLTGLVGPAHDVEDLRAVLENPDIAGFEVEVLVNQPRLVVANAISDRFADSRHDDTILLYFSGHGLKNDNSHLYLAMTDTYRDKLSITGLSADLVDELLGALPSGRKLIVLDCCFSGAYPTGRLGAKGVVADAHTRDRFGGKGRYVLTASDAIEPAWDGDHLHGEVKWSEFTRYMIAGLSDGSADLDGDGEITVDELYTYISARVTNQRPKKFSAVEGVVVFAKNINWRLPSALREDLRSPNAHNRVAAAERLAGLYQVGSDVVRTRVREELGNLADDEHAVVASTATRHLRSILQQPDTAESDDEPPPAMSRRRRRLLAVAAGVVLALAATGMILSNTERGERFCGRPHLLTGPVLAKYREHQRLEKENGRPAVLCPVTSVRAAPVGDGEYAVFDTVHSEYTSWIYWSPSTGAHLAQGEIGKKWAELGLVTGSLGYPITDEIENPGGGRRAAFQNGMIYWHSTRSQGAHPVFAEFFGVWARQGPNEKHERGPLGYPIGDVVRTPDGGRYQNFEGGEIVEHPTRSNGPQAVMIRIFAEWHRHGGREGAYGYPVGSEIQVGRTYSQQFEHNTITWDDAAQQYR